MEKYSSEFLARYNVYKYMYIYRCDVRDTRNGRKTAYITWRGLEEKSSKRTLIKQRFSLSFSLSLLPVNGYYCLLSYCLRVSFFFFLTQYVEKNGTKEHKRNGSKKKREREREVEESERNGWKIKRTTSRISLWRGEV